MTPDLKHVLEAFRGNQRRFWKLVLEHRVGDDGRAVDQQGDVPSIDVGNLEALSHRLDQRAGMVVAPTWHLGDGNFPGILFKDRDIGKCPTCVDAESNRTHWHTPTIRNC